MGFTRMNAGIHSDEGSKGTVAAVRVALPRAEHKRLRSRASRRSQASSARPHSRRPAPRAPRLTHQLAPRRYLYKGANLGRWTRRSKYISVCLYSNF